MYVCVGNAIRMGDGWGAREGEGCGMLNGSDGCEVRGVENVWCVGIRLVVMGGEVWEWVKNHWGASHWGFGHAFTTSVSLSGTKLGEHVGKRS